MEWNVEPFLCTGTEIEVQETMDADLRFNMFILENLTLVNMHAS